jgi:hypothetical protein
MLERTYDKAPLDIRKIPACRCLFFCRRSFLRRRLLCCRGLFCCCGFTLYPPELFPQPANAAAVKVTASNVEIIFFFILLVLL